MPTVFVAAGVSAVISALIVSIGVVGVLFAVDSDDSSSSAALPTVVNLGAAANQQGTTPAAAQPTTAAPAPAAPAPTTTAAAPAPAVGGGTTSGGGYAPQAPAATAAPTVAPTTEAEAAPAALSAGELQNKLKLVLNGSSAQRADELEAGNRGVPVGEGIGNTLRTFEPAGVKWRIAGPVNVSGNTLSANLILSSPGFNDATMSLTWVWKDGKWKLSNTSACEVAGYAQVPCNL
jgi:hypothetical protein